MNEVGFENIQKQELELLDYGTKRLEIEGLKIFGTAKEKTSVISFNIEGIHPYDIGTIIDKLGIAVRTGHHCAQPIMTFRYSRNNTSFFFFYNTKEEIDVMVEAVKEQHSCCLNNLNDENTIFTTIDCFLGRAARDKTSKF
jgi:cysteine desulfurase/selenocysteine lyase